MLDRISTLIMEHFEIGDLSLSMLTLLRHSAGQRVPASASKHTFVSSAPIGTKRMTNAMTSR